MPVAVGAWGTAAIATLLPAATSIWIASVAVAVALLLRHGRGLSVALGGAALGIAIVAPSVAWHVHRLHSGEVPRLAHRHADLPVVVRLVRDPLPVGGTGSSGLLVVDATAVSVDDGNWRSVDVPVLVLARGALWQGLLPGQRVRVDARFVAPRRGDDVAAVLDATDSPVPLGRPPWWQRAAGRARSSLRRACSSLSPDARGLLPSLVDGDTTGVPAELHTDMQVAGLSHLEAVSGENLSVVLAVSLSVAQRLGLRRRSRVVGAAVAVVGFVVLARPSPSVQRAALMSAVTLIAMFAGRRSSGRPALAVAVLALVALDPFLARSVGFVLSVSATAGIIVLAPRWTARLEAWLPQPIALAVAVSAAAQLACTPALVLAFGQLTPYAVPANVLAAAAVVPATVLGLVTAVIASIAPGLAVPVAWLGAVPTTGVAWVAHVFASLPGAAAQLSRGPAVTVAIAATAILFWAATRRVEPPSREIL
ncbi:MAG TPA: ComEC/Rec2 family competence protein [Mycobacteriales bacterium]|nr:ComEC/Rec2 family competence protein [Mycobacteriales bacterium]